MMGMLVLLDPGSRDRADHVEGRARVDYPGGNGRLRSVRPRQLADLHRAATLEHRIADQQGSHLIEAVGFDPDEAGQMCRQWRGRAGLAQSDAGADRAAALEE